MTDDDYSRSAVEKLVHVGISGWTYPDWRGTFYPDHVKAKDELAYASRTLSSIEVNGTFYRLQKAHSYAEWYKVTPDDFIFAFKAPKYVTHERRLKDFETPVANFFASGLLLMKEKLGPILWQLPPNLPYQRERLEPFLAALPHTFEAAMAIAKGHSDWLAERAVTAVEYSGRLRHALEVRNESYLCAEFIDMLRRYGIAVVIGDTEGRWPYIEDQTADFTYIRLHGDETKYPDGYTVEALTEWEERVRKWAAGSLPKVPRTVLPAIATGAPREVFVYFDNDHKTAAPFNAVQFLGRIMPQHLRLAPVILTLNEGKGKDLDRTKKKAVRMAGTKVAATKKKSVATKMKKPTEKKSPAKAKKKKS